MTFAFIFDSVGGTEWILLLGVILIVIGPKNLPAAARKLGGMMTKLRRAADEFKRQVMAMDNEIRQAADEAMKTDYVETPTGGDSSADGSEDRAETDYYGGEYNPDSPYPGHDYYDETQDATSGGSEMGDGDATAAEVAAPEAAKPEPVKTEPEKPVRKPPADPYAITITVSTSASAKTKSKSKSKSKDAT